MASILDRIVDAKWQAIATARARVPEADLDRLVATLPPVRDFTGAITRSSALSVIAEIKKASPSAGVIRADFDPVAIAKTYERHGAACISVLTDEPFFQGHLQHLTAVRAAVGLPVLRKDFILDRYQLLEARIAGADAILLIAEILPGNDLATLHDQAIELGLHPLVELHDAEQLPRVLSAGAKLVGINNRDLRTFATSLEKTLELIPRFPKGVTVVSESGIRTRADVDRLATAGVKAVLVGETLLRAADIGAELDKLRGV